MGVPNDRDILAAILIESKREKGRALVILNSTKRGVVVHEARKVFREVEAARSTYARRPVGDALKAIVEEKAFLHLDAPDFRRAYVLIVMCLYSMRKYGRTAMLRANNMTESDIPIDPTDHRSSPSVQLDLFDHTRP